MVKYPLNHPNWAIVWIDSNVVNHHPFRLKTNKIKKCDFPIFGSLQKMKIVVHHKPQFIVTSFFFNSDDRKFHFKFFVFLSFISYQSTKANGGSSSTPTPFVTQPDRALCKLFVSRGEIQERRQNAATNRHSDDVIQNTVGIGRSQLAVDNPIRSASNDKQMIH